MGDRHPTNEHGIYSASLYCVMGVGYAALLSLLLLLAGSWSAVREKRALLLLWGGIILAYPYVFAGGLCSIMGLRPLSNFFSPLALDLNSGGH